MTRVWCVLYRKRSTPTGTDVVVGSGFVGRCPSEVPLNPSLLLVEEDIVRT